MIDYIPTLKTQLETIGIPVQHELFMDSETSLPCITFQQVGDEATVEGNNNIRYSNVRFRIKLWGAGLAALTPYRSQVDTLMFSLGLKRTNYNELWFNQDLCMILDYQGLGKE